MLRENPYAMTTEVQPQYNNRSAAVASTVKSEKHPFRLASASIARKCLLAKCASKFLPIRIANLNLIGVRASNQEILNAFFLATEALSPLSKRKYTKKHPYFLQKA
jgi:hypothetical protein